MYRNVMPEINWLYLVHTPESMWQGVQISIVCREKLCKLNSVNYQPDLNFGHFSKPTFS